MPGDKVEVAGAVGTAIVLTTVAVPFFTRAYDAFKYKMDKYGEDQVAEIQGIKKAYLKYCHLEKTGSITTIQINTISRTNPEFAGLPVYFHMLDEDQMPLLFAEKFVPTLDSEEWRDKSNKSSLIRFYVEGMLSRICQYQKNRKKRLLSGGYDYDPTNLFFEEFKHWLIEISKAEVSEHLKSIIENRMKYLRELQLNKTFRPSDDIDTRVKTTNSLMEQMQNGFNFLKDELSRRGAHAQLNDLRVQVSAILSNSIKFLFYVFRNTPGISVDFMISEIQNPQTPDAINAIRKTTSGQLLQFLLTGETFLEALPEINSAKQISANSLVMRFSDDNQVMRLPFDIGKKNKLTLDNWYNEKSCQENQLSSGILAEFAVPHDMTRFLKFHNLIEQIANFNSICKKLFKLSVAGGDILAYGYGMRIVQTCLHGARKVFDLVEENLDFLYKRAQAYKKTLDSRSAIKDQKIKSWDSFHKLATTAYDELKDEISKVKILLVEIEKKMSEVNSQEYKDQLKEDIQTLVRNTHQFLQGLGLQSMGDIQFPTISIPDAPSRLPMIHPESPTNCPEEIVRNDEVLKQLMQLPQGATFLPLSSAEDSFFVSFLEATKLICPKDMADSSTAKLRKLCYDFFQANDEKMVKYYQELPAIDPASVKLKPTTEVSHYQDILSSVKNPLLGHVLVEGRILLRALNKERINKIQVISLSTDGKVIYYELKNGHKPKLLEKNQFEYKEGCIYLISINNICQAINIPLPPKKSIPAEIIGFVKSKLPSNNGEKNDADKTNAVSSEDNSDSSIHQMSPMDSICERAKLPSGSSVREGTENGMNGFFAALAMSLQEKNTSAKEITPNILRQDCLNFFLDNEKVELEEIRRIELEEAKIHDKIKEIKVGSTEKEKEKSSKQEKKEKIKLDELTAKKDKVIGKNKIKKWYIELRGHQINTDDYKKYIQPITPSTTAIPKSPVVNFACDPHIEGRVICRVHKIKLCWISMTPNDKKIWLITKSGVKSVKQLPEDKHTIYIISDQQKFYSLSLDQKNVQSMPRYQPGENQVTPSPEDGASANTSTAASYYEDDIGSRTSVNSIPYRQQVKSSSLNEPSDPSTGVLLASFSAKDPSDSSYSSKNKKISKQKAEQLREQLQPKPSIEKVYVNRQNLTDKDYWYNSSNINELLNAQLKDDEEAAIFAPSFPLLNEMGGASAKLFQKFIRGSLNGRLPSVIPINLLQDTKVNEYGLPTNKLLVGTHWIGLAVLPDVSNQLSPKIMLIDSFGNGMNRDYVISTSNQTLQDVSNILIENPVARNRWQKTCQLIRLIESVIQELNIKPKIIVTGLEQQAEDNCSDCGPFVVDNLVNIVKKEKILRRDPSELRQQHESQLQLTEKRKNSYLDSSHNSNNSTFDRVGKKGNNMNVSLDKTIIILAGILQPNPYFYLIDYYSTVKENNETSPTLSSLYLGVNSSEQETINVLFKQWKILPDYMTTPQYEAQSSVCRFNDARQMLVVINCLCELGWLMPSKKTQELLYLREKLEPDNVFILLQRNDDNLTMLELRKDKKARILVLLAQRYRDENVKYKAIENALLGIYVYKNHFSFDSSMRDDVHHAKSQSQPCWAVVNSEKVQDMLIALVDKGMLDLNLLSDYCKNFISAVDPDCFNRMQTSFNRRKLSNSDYVDNKSWDIKHLYSEEEFNKNMLQAAFEALEKDNVELLHILTGGNLKEESSILGKAQNLDMSSAIIQSSRISSEQLVERFISFMVELIGSRLINESIIEQKTYENRVLELLRAARAYAIAECLAEFEKEGGCYWPQERSGQPIYICFSEEFKCLAEEKLKGPYKALQEDLLRRGKIGIRYSEALNPWLEKQRQELSKVEDKKDARNKTRKVLVDAQRREQGIELVLKVKELLPKIYITQTLPVLRVVLRKACIKDINARDIEGWSLLDRAIAKGNYCAAYYLVKQGANITQGEYAKLALSSLVKKDIPPITFEKLKEMKAGEIDKESSYLNLIQSRLLVQYPTELNKDIDLYTSTFMGLLKFSGNSMKQRCEYIGELEQLKNRARVKYDDTNLRKRLIEMQDSLQTPLFGRRSNARFFKYIDEANKQQETGKVKLSIANQPPKLVTQKAHKEEDSKPASSVPKKGMT